MRGDPRMIEFLFGAGKMGFVLIEPRLVDENVARFLAGGRHPFIANRFVPERAANEDDLSRVAAESAKQSHERLLIGGLRIECAQRRDILSDGHHDEIGLEGNRLTQARGDVKRLKLSFEVRDVAYQ